jgi:hypothetical protein
MQPNPNSMLGDVVRALAIRISTFTADDPHMTAYYCGCLDTLCMIYPITVTAARQMVEQELKKL